MDVSSKAGMNLNRLMAVLSQGPLPHRPPPLTQLAIDIAEDDIEKIRCGRDGLANNKACVHTQPRLHTAGATGSIPVAPTIIQVLTNTLIRKYQTSIKRRAAESGRDELVPSAYNHSR